MRERLTNAAWVLLALVGVAAAILSVTHPELGKLDGWGKAQKQRVVAHRKTGPAPTLRRATMPGGMKGNRHMPKLLGWSASGARDGRFNDFYTENGTYGGKAAYQGYNNGMWLWWSVSRWVLTPTKGSYIHNPPGEIIPYFGNGGVALPCNPWIVSDASGGSVPAPTMTTVSTSIDWPWPWWEEATPTFGDNSVFGPCAATLGGTAYIAMPANDATAGVYGFELFNLGTKVFSHVAKTGALFTAGQFDTVQTAAAFDVGDGSHIDVNGGLWMDGATPKFIWKRFSVTPGGTASQTATVTVTLASKHITPFIETAVGQYAFVMVDGSNAYLATYAAGAATVTAGVAMALPALPGGYADVECGTGGRYDMVLFVRGGVKYLLRHARSGSTDRVFVYTVTASAVTALADDLSVAFPTSSYRHTWGDDPERDCVFGDLGMPPDTTVGCTTERWVPGSNGISHFGFALYPAEQRWYLQAGGVLYVVGWCDADYDFRPFVLDTTPTPRIMETVDGTTVTSGEVVVASMQPVGIPADGTVVANGEAHLIGTTEIKGVDGTAQVDGSANLLASTGATNPDEGLGSFIDVKLTAGIWPGAERRYGVPSWYERAANRGYGGILSAPAKPSVRDRIATGNALSQYAAWWSWFSEDADDRTRLADATAYERDGVLGEQVYDNYTFTVSGCTTTAANQEYIPDRFEVGSEWWQNTYTSEDGDYRVVPSWNANPWALLDAGDNILAWCNLDRFPWSKVWSNETGGGTCLVTQGSLVSRWRSNGLEASNYFLQLPVDMGAVLDGNVPVFGSAWTLVADYIPYIAQVGHVVLQTATVAGARSAVSLQHLTSGGAISGLRLHHYHAGVSGVVDWTFASAVALGDAMRVVVSVDAVPMARAWLNGVSLGAAQSAAAVVHGGTPTGPITQVCGNNHNGNWNYAGYIAREMGYLAEYAATDADVTGNSALSRLYGFKGTPFAATDDAV